METETGNPTENIVDLPSYWESLVEFMGDKCGLWHVEFGSSDSTQQVEDDSMESTADPLIGTQNESDASLDASHSLRKRMVAQEIQRQRKLRRQSKMDVGMGLVTMGETLAKGLVDAATASKNSNVLQSVLDNLEAAKTVNEAILRSIEDGHKTNKAILDHLQRM
jgi:hypothetical protein